MTVREELIREIEQTSDDVLEVLLSFLRQRRLSNSEVFGRWSLLRFRVPN
jgi:hypothetical protein